MEYDPDGQIEPIGREALYRQLAGILAARIERGDWKPGQPIPSESRLQQEYGLSRVTVRKAVAVLADMGLVVVAPARGTFVTQR